MDSHYQITDYNPELRAPIVALLNDHLWFDDLYKSEARFIYKYESNPYRVEPIGLVALYNHRVVGYRAFYKTPWQLGDDHTHTLWMVSLTDTVVHPQHQRKGLFGALLRVGFKKLENGPYTAYLNLSSNYKVKNSLLKFGWKLLSGITFARSYTLPRLLNYTCRVKLGRAFWESSRVHGRFGRIEFSNELKAGEMAILLKTTHADSGKFTLKKDEAYLSYRYGSPHSRYFFVYDWGPGAMEGFLGIRIIGKGGNAHVIDYAYTSSDGLERMVAFLMHEGHFDILSIWSFGLTQEFRRVLSGLNFKTNNLIARMTNTKKQIQYCLVRPMAEKPSDDDWFSFGKDFRNINNWDLRELCADDS